MSQWIKVPDTKFDNLSLSTRTHTVEKATYFNKLSSDLHAPPHI